MANFNKANEKKFFTTFSEADRLFRKSFILEISASLLTFFIVYQKNNV